MRALGRWRPTVAPRVAAVAMAANALVAPQTPTAALPRVRRVLVVAPHPDDETIGCGGTIARLAARGTRVVVVSVTDGEATIGSPHSPPETARRRHSELVAACARLGAGPPRRLQLPDGAVASHHAAAVAGLTRAVADVEPELVFTPWYLERHADHRAVTAALAEVPGLPPEVWGYEAHTPIPLPDRIVDVTAAIATKQAALADHATADLAFELHTTLALSKWRSLATDGGRGWAEAFLTMPPGRIGELVVRGDAAWRGRGQLDCTFR